MASPAAAALLFGLVTAASPMRVLVDAGHGAPDNEGAQTTYCEKEQDVVLELAVDLAKRLEARGGMLVKLTRQGNERPTYEARRALADSFRADVVLSLHLDTRGEPVLVRTSSGTECLRTEEHQGVSVLYADRGGTPELHAKRRRLARALVDAIGRAGLPIYGGEDYVGLYDNDATRGAYIDRRSIFFLRRLRQPTVIIETHQGLSTEDRARWKREDTRAQFAKAVGDALEELARTRWR